MKIKVDEQVFTDQWPSTVAVVKFEWPDSTEKSVAVSLMLDRLNSHEEFLLRLRDFATVLQSLTNEELQKCAR